MDASLFSSPEFQTLLSHNDWPSSDTQIQEIAAERQAQLTRLAAIEDELSLVEARLEKLKQEKEQVLQKVASCKTVLHPVRRLPPEILREIFSYAATWRPEKGAYTNIAPWRLSHACRRWREICLGFPSLWTELEFGDRDFDSSHYNYHNSNTRFPAALLLAQHLQHSQNRPLDVSINCSSNIPERASILHALLPTSPRWRFLSLSIPLRSFSALLPIRAALPNLHSLEIKLSDRPAPGPRNIEESSLQHLFQFAPQLYELYGDRTVLSTACIPRKAITHYDEFTYSKRSEKWFQDFGQMQNLVFCCLTVTTEDAVIPPESQFGPYRIQLQHLKHLKLKFTGVVEEEGAQVFLSRFDVPNLAILDVCYAAENIKTTTFGQFSSIQHLLLLALPKQENGDMIPGKDVVNVLHSLPTLHTIFLGPSFKLDEELVDAILESEFAPTLTTIYYQRRMMSQEEEDLHKKLEESEIRSVYFKGNEHAYRECYGYEYGDLEEGDPQQA